jgi:hippurate hydrolase
MEERTAGVVAANLEAAGFQVTKNVGGHGVVGVMNNGNGPTLLIRADMDALPILEETGLPYASRVRAVNPRTGMEGPVAHMCCHDVHVTVLIGTARVLAAMKDHWHGTLVLVAQPAEELGLGARALLADGLYRRFPRPDWAIALHAASELPAGTVATIEGFAMANVDKLDITVRGRGGHAAAPHTTKDPVVLAAKIVMSLQTIVSRETDPIQPALLTVGSIHGGTKHNIIPDEVTLQLTLRTYSDETRKHSLEAVRRICRGEAIASGVPEDMMPIVVHIDEKTATPALYNDPKLTRRLRAAFQDWLGAPQVKTFERAMTGEDFSQFGRTVEQVPLCLFRLGVVARRTYEASERGGPSLPSLHSSRLAPDPQPTLVTGVMAMSAAALDLLAPTR